jgi:Flp pilus assembly protein TadG
MSRQRESTIVFCTRSAMVCFAHIATLRTPGCLFLRFARLKRDAGFSNGKPVPSLRKLKGEDGNNLIEYALVFMLFMSMLLGIVDFSRALYSYHFLSDAAREATRWAAVNGAACGAPSSSNPAGDNSCNGVGGMNNGTASESDIQAYVTNITPPGVDTTKLTTTASWPGTGAVCAVPKNPGCPVDVQVSYQFTFVVPFIRTTPLTLSSSSEMIILH